jgi:hypothetical protein
MISEAAEPFRLNERVSAISRLTFLPTLVVFPRGAIGTTKPIAPELPSRTHCFEVAFGAWKALTLLG